MERHERARGRRLRCLAVALLGALTAAGCAARAPTGQPPSAETAGQVGGIMLIDDLNQRTADKVVVASFLFRPANVTPQDVVVAFGSGSRSRSDVSDFRIRLVDAQGRTLDEYGIFDPRKAVVEQQGLVENPEAVYAAKFGFDPRAHEIQVTDRQGTVLASAEIAAVMREFCAKLRTDEDCRRMRAE